MALELFGHPFSSYTQKVLVALYENATPFTFREIGPGHPETVAEWRRRWPMARFPLLVDEGRHWAEASVIIEYLGLAHPGPVPLIPADPKAALEVRMLDRFFDLHVMSAVQIAVDAALGRSGASAETGRQIARQRLAVAYEWADGWMRGRSWAAGDSFTLADCAAAPALFYADWTEEIPAALGHLRAYRTRLLARPSFARAVEEARYFRPHFPLGAPDRD